MWSNQLAEKIPKSFQFTWVSHSYKDLTPKTMISAPFLKQHKIFDKLLKVFIFTDKGNKPQLFNLFRYRVKEFWQNVKMIPEEVMCLFGLWKRTQIIKNSGSCKIKFKN